MINYAICIDGLGNHLLCPMQCHLNGVQFIEFPKVLAENHSKTTNAIELVNPFSAAHPLIIPLQSSGVASYFDAYSPSVAEYENDVISKIHLTVEGLLEIHEQKNIQKERLKCLIIEVRSVSLPQQ